MHGRWLGGTGVSMSGTNPLFVERRPLGRTGIDVPLLSFGAAPLGGVYGPVSQAGVNAAVRAALAAGVNLFDTSPYYGSGRSESVLGRALAGIPRESFLVATKVGRYGASAFDFSAARVRASIDESLARLGLDHVDVILCHDIEFGDQEIIVNEALPTLRAAVAAGKARAIGVTGLPLDVLVETAARTPVDIILSYCHLCLCDATLAERVAGLGVAGVGIINASPLSMGLLTDNGPPAWHPAPSALRAACAAAAAACRTRGASLSELALAWTLSQPGIATTLVGMADPATVAANLRAAHTTPDPDLLALVRRILAPVQGVTWPSPPV